ncbi:hypothetical protein ACUX5M_24070, partial [Salmonella enterica]
MTTRITLWRELFSEQPRILLENDDFTVTAFRYASGVEGLKIQNSRGHLVILPWMGQMIWDAQFDGHDLTMRNMFRQPKPAAEVVATYGGTVAKLAMRQPFVLFKGLTFQKLCLPGAFRPGDHHNKMLRPG